MSDPTPNDPTPADPTPGATKSRRPIALTKLIATLERLYPDRELSEMVVTHAGMTAGLIAYSPRSIVNWTNIVNEAIRQNALDSLVETAAEQFPNVPELKQHLADYKKWTEQHAAEPAVIAQATSDTPPGFFERARLAIVAWFSIAVGCFALIGVVARESLHLFFDLPSNAHIAKALTAPGAAAEAGFRFVVRTLIAATYLSYNPIGAVLTIAVAAALLYFGARRPKLVERAYQPLVIVPVVVTAAVAKTLVFDFPTFWFRRVLTTLSVDVRTFDVPSMFLPRADAIWRGVVCSRIGSLEAADAICGGARTRDHLQNLFGAYLMNVFITIVICTVAVSVLRRLVLPSPDRRWNVPRSWKPAFVVTTTLAVLTALLAVPWTYARTVASMDFPYICNDDECSLRICASDDDCFAFIPADAEIVPADPRPPAMQHSTKDVLDTAFRVQLKAPEVNPHDRANRFGGD